MENIIKLALVGRNISHSLSERIYSDLLNRKIQYKLFDVKKEKDLPKLDEIFSEYQGLSITSPYKKSYLGDLNNSNAFSAINTIRKDESGYVGTNTDLVAIKAQVANFLDNYPFVEFQVLGDGAMAELVTFELKNLNLEFKQFSRKKNSDFYTKIFKVKDNDSQSVLINCCAREFDFKNKIDQDYIFWDLNYGHDFHAKHLSKSVKKYLDGQNFLKIQAQAALKFWGLE